VIECFIIRTIMQSCHCGIVGGGVEEAMVHLLVMFHTWMLPWTTIVSILTLVSTQFRQPALGWLCVVVASWLLIKSVALLQQLIDLLGRVWHA
jgi:hypothetical protein